jgi:hypothetical protein
MATKTPGDVSPPVVANPVDRYVNEFLEEHHQKSSPTTNAFENPPGQEVFRTACSPNLVCLHEDALAGTQALLSTQVKRGQRLSVEEVPYALRRLNASQLGDFLRIYALRIKAFTTTDWIRIDRDWQGT